MRAARHLFKSSFLAGALALLGEPPAVLSQVLAPGIYYKLPSVTTGTGPLRLIGGSAPFNLDFPGPGFDLRGAGAIHLAVSRDDARLLDPGRVRILRRADGRTHCGPEDAGVGGPRGAGLSARHAFPGPISCRAAPSSPALS